MGMLNSLSQLILKLTSPGVPDIYQGNEIWDFSLVDPDNRRQVDFIQRNQMLDGLKNNLESLNEYLKYAKDGRIKLFITNETLKLRQKNTKLFLSGDYIPLKIHGTRPELALAFGRHFEGKTCIVLTTKFFSFFMESFNQYKDKDIWKTHFLEIPENMIGSFRNIYTNENHTFSESMIPIHDLFSVMPFIVLECL